MKATAGALLVAIGLASFAVLSRGDARPGVAGEATPGPSAAPTSLIAAAPYDVVFVGLQWQDNADNEDSYVIERSTGGAEGPWQEIATLAANTTFASDNDVAPHTTYWYRVAAVNEAGATYSNVSKTTTDEPWPPTPTPAPALLGDVNNDRLINGLDALWVLQYVAGMIHTMVPPQNADVNEDGLIDALDATLILQYEAGLIDSLPPEA